MPRREGTAFTRECHRNDPRETNGSTGRRRPITPSTAAASRLRAAGHDVGVVDESHCPAALPGRRGDPTDVGCLDDAGLSDVETVVVATPSDARNLLVAGLVRTRFDVPRSVVLTNAPERVAVVAEVGHDPARATAALSDALVDSV